MCNHDPRNHRIFCPCCGEHFDVCCDCFVEIMCPEGTAELCDSCREESDEKEN